MSEPFSLAGKKALVTGGSRGIGLGIASGLAKAGAQVCIVGRDEARNAQALGTLGKSARSFTCDLEDTAGIEAFYRDASKAVGGFDILANNAGLTLRGRADQVSIADWDRVIKIDLTAPFVLSQCFAREHIAAKKSHGCIIMTASLMCLSRRA